MQVIACKNYVRENKYDAKERWNATVDTAC